MTIVTFKFYDISLYIKEQKKIKERLSKNGINEVISFNNQPESMKIIITVPNYYIPSIYNVYGEITHINNLKDCKKSDCVIEMDLKNSEEARKNKRTLLLV